MRKFKWMIAGSILVIALSGCAGQKVQNTSNTSSQEAKITEGSQGNMNQGGQDEKNKKQERSDYIGEITNIVGNEVTLKLAKMPEMSQTPENKDNKTDKTSDNKPKAITGISGNAAPGGFQRRNNQGNSQRTGQRGGFAMKLEYSGEEKSFQIPVGMNVTMRRGQEAVTFETLEKGNILMIWVDDADETIVTQVTLMGGSSSSSGTGGGMGLMPEGGPIPEGGAAPGARVGGRNGN